MLFPELPSDLVHFESFCDTARFYKIVGAQEIYNPLKGPPAPIHRFGKRVLRYSWTIRAYWYGTQSSRNSTMSFV